MGRGNTSAPPTLFGAASNLPRGADQTMLARQPVQQVYGLTARSPLIDALANVDRDAGHDPGFGPRPGAFHRPVHVAAKQGHDLIVPADNAFECACLVGMPVTADVVVVDIERRMMNKH